MNRGPMSSSNPPLPKMMLGFVVRRCAVAVGHEPSPEEFAAWANHYQHGGKTVRLFGRVISVSEAGVILRHRGRPVSARNVAAQERLAEESETGRDNVTSFAEARMRLRARAAGRRK